MQRTAPFLDALTRLDELKEQSDQAGASKRAKGVSAGTIDVRPFAGQGRISSGKLWGIEGEEGIELLSNGNLLGELELREVNEEIATKAKEEKKVQKDDKKRDEFAALVQKKPEPEKWGKGDLTTLALVYKKIIRGVDAKDKDKEELGRIWKAKGNLTIDEDEVVEVDYGDEDEEEEGAASAEEKAKQAEKRKGLIATFSTLTNEQMELLLFKVPTK